MAWKLDGNSTDRQAVVARTTTLLNRRALFVVCALALVVLLACGDSGGSPGTNFVSRLQLEESQRATSALFKQLEKVCDVILSLAGRSSAYEDFYLAECDRYINPDPPPPEFGN